MWGENQVKTGDHWRIFADYPLSGKSGIEVSFNVKLVLTHNTSLILSTFLQSLATIKYPKTALGPADELRWLHEFAKNVERGPASAHRPLIWLSWSTDTRYYNGTLNATYLHRGVFPLTIPRTAFVIAELKKQLSIDQNKYSWEGGGPADALKPDLVLPAFSHASVSKKCQPWDSSQIMLQSNRFSVF